MAVVAGLVCAVAADPDWESGETQEARIVLEKLKTAIESAAKDEAESILEDEVFNAAPRLQTGFLRFLDGEWERRKREYIQIHHLKTASLHDSVVTAEKMREIRRHRETLSRIRALPDDEEMKEAIESDGNAALAALEKLFSPSTRDPVDGIPELRELRERLLLAGECRLLLREEMLEPVPAPPDEELAASLPDPKTLTIPLSGKARAVLRKNGDLAAEIEAPEARGIAHLNHWRILLGLEPLLIDPKLCEATRDHSTDMAEEGFFSHTNPDPKKASFTDRARLFGTSAAAENIATAGGPEEANRSWFGSPGHHRTLFGRYSVAGLGAYGDCWTLNVR
jgi:uncharacterized protein YkwD